jgi:hypothetical protein
MPTINTRRGDDHPKRYKNPIGTVIQPGNFSTRIGYERYARVDARLNNDKRLLDDEIANYEAEQLEASAVRELVKGLIIKWPELFKSDSWSMTLQIANQLLPVKLRKKLRDGTILFSEIAPYIHPGKTASTLSQVRNSDGDTEDAVPEEDYLDWQNKTWEKTKNKGLALLRRDRRNMCRYIHGSMRGLDRANEIRARHPELQKDVGPLGIHENTRLGKKKDFTDSRLAELEEDGTSS